MSDTKKTQESKKESPKETTKSLQTPQEIERDRLRSNQDGTRITDSVEIPVRGTLLQELMNLLKKSRMLGIL
jgi:hypothetical protein